MLDRKQLATFRLARLYLARGETKKQALEQVEALRAKRENRLPIPLNGVKRLGQFRTLPKHIRPNRDGWILPLWTVSRFDKAIVVYDEALALWYMCIRPSRFSEVTHTRRTCGFELHSTLTEMQRRDQ